MDFARAMGDTAVTKMDVVTYTYPEKSILTYLKKHGAEFTPEQEELRKQHEEKAGTTLERPVEELIAETKIWKELMEKYKDLFEAYKAEHEVANDTEAEDKKPDNELYANGFFEDQRMKVGQLDTIVGYRPFVSQVIPLRSLPYNLKSLDEKYARYLLDKEKELIIHPFLFAEAERLYAKAFPQQNDSTYVLPEGPATEIFRNIIKAHTGKALFTISGQRFAVPVVEAEHTAGLRQQYKNIPDFRLYT